MSRNDLTIRSIADSGSRVFKILSGICCSYYDGRAGCPEAEAGLPAGGHHIIPGRKEVNPMSKFGKKVSTLLLAAVIAVSSVIPAAAASSPTEGNDVEPDTKVTIEKKGTKVTAVSTGDDTVKVTKVKSDEKKATVPASFTYDGQTYTVESIETGAITKKYDKVTLILNDETKVRKKVAKSKKAKKTTKILIKAAKGTKLKASQFNKEAFKGFKGKIKVKARNMTKKEFKKLVKKLRKGGFKGYIYRKE